MGAYIVYLYREAAAIAMVRLQDRDPLLVEVYTSWATQLEKEGSFEQAAKWQVGLYGDMSTYETCQVCFYIKNVLVALEGIP